MSDRADLGLRVANLLADAADAVTVPFFQRGDLLVASKPDGSTVTEADLAYEAAIRNRLRLLDPHAVLLGEQDGGSLEAGERWIVDPIDGTENFSRGVPIWATLIAKEEASEIVVAVISVPALGTRYQATKGGGAYRNGRQIGVSRRMTSHHATFACGGLHECPSDSDLHRVVAARPQVPLCMGVGPIFGSSVDGSRTLTAGSLLSSNRWLDEPLVKDLS